MQEKQKKEEAMSLLDMRMEADKLFAEKQTERQRNVRENYKQLQGSFFMESKPTQIFDQNTDKNFIWSIFVAVIILNQSRL